ncbi:MAG UNVERIFIED_CONTAM: hypothetical protein LVR18_42690 [Planctomycetaceae bacterium]
MHSNESGCTGYKNSPYSCLTAPAAQRCDFADSPVLPGSRCVRAHLRLSRRSSAAAAIARAAGSMF